MFQFFKASSARNRTDYTPNISIRNHNDGDYFLQIEHILILCVFVLCIGFNLLLFDATNDTKFNHSLLQNQQIIINSNWISDAPILLHFEQTVFSGCGRYNIMISLAMILQKCCFMR
eukprot:802566_1